MDTLAARCYREKVRPVAWGCKRSMDRLVVVTDVQPNVVEENATEDVNIARNATCLVAFNAAETK